MKRAFLVVGLSAVLGALAGAFAGLMIAVNVFGASYEGVQNSEEPAAVLVQIALIAIGALAGAFFAWRLRK